MEQKIKFLICPYPDTLGSCVGQLILEWAGMLSEKPIVLMHGRPTIALDRRKDPQVFYLFGKDFCGVLASLLPRIIDGRMRHLLSRYLNYVRCGSGAVEALGFDAELWNYSEMLRSVYRKGQFFKTHKNFISFLEYLLGEGFDPTRGATSSEDLLINDRMLLDLKRRKREELEERLDRRSEIPPGWANLNAFRTLMLPIYAEGVRPPVAWPRPTEGWERIRFFLREAWMLQIAPLVVAVAGPAGSGKSTITISLVEAMQRLIEEFKSIPGLEALSVSAGYLDLDLGTPTVSAIQEGEGQNRERTEGLKCEWDIDLAVRAQRSLIREYDSGSGRVLIADAPGRPTEETMIAISSADASIVIAKDLKSLQHWKNFMRKLGLPIVATATVHEGSSSIDSMVTSYSRSKKELCGFVKGLTRKTKAQDIFIDTLALVLLLDILPSFARKELERLNRQIQ